MIHHFGKSYFQSYGQEATDFLHRDQSIQIVHLCDVPLVCFIHHV